MTEETRVGFMSTSIIEEMLKDYITAFTNEGKYKGKLEYLKIYRDLRKYIKTAVNQINERNDNKYWGK